MRLSAFPLLTLSLAALLTAGCVTVGVGKTEREWNAALEALEPGLTQQQVLTMLGEPRERHDAEPGDAVTSTWIYSRPEIEGTERKMVGEQEVMLPNGKHSISVPYFEDRDIRVVAEYHLHWEGDTLAKWERIVDRLPGR